MKKIFVARKNWSVGIWDNEEIVVRIYREMTVMVIPTVTWRNNSGSLDFIRLTLRGRDHIDILHCMAIAIECGDHDINDIDVDDSIIDMGVILEQRC